MTRANAISLGLRYCICIAVATFFQGGCTHPAVEVKESPTANPVHTSPTNDKAAVAKAPEVAPVSPASALPAASSVKVNQTSDRIDGMTPLQVIEDSIARTRNLREFTTRFQRRERLGLFNEMAPQENILAEYRDEPFSVRFTWQDADSEYRQAVYVRGKNDSKVCLLPRKGLLGFKPSVQRFAPELAVQFKKARNPITDFGPRRMLERVTDGLTRSQAFGGANLAYLGKKKIGPADESCLHFEIRYPPNPQATVGMQDLYINELTRLPLASFLYRPGTTERSEAALTAMYIYAQIDTTVRLSDANFEIDLPVEPVKAKSVKSHEAAESAKPIMAGDSNNE